MMMMMMMMMTMMTMSMTRTVIVINLLPIYSIQVMYNNHKLHTFTEVLSWPAPQSFALAKHLSHSDLLLQPFEKKPQMMWMSSVCFPPQNKLHINKTQPKKTHQSLQPSRFSIQATHFDFFQYFLRHQVAKHLDFAFGSWTTWLPIWHGKVRPDLDSKKKGVKMRKKKEFIPYHQKPYYSIYSIT